MADPHTVTEFCIVSSLATLVAAINNEGHPTLAKPSGPYPFQPSDDTDNNDHSCILNATATVLMCTSEDLAAIICKPLPPAYFMLVSEPNPYQIYVLESTESVTCPGSEVDPNNSDDELSNGEDGDDVQNLNGSEDLPNIAIPDTHDQPFGLEWCVLVKVGESHMPKILDKYNHWERCLQTP